MKLLNKLPKFTYPLLSNAFNNEDISCGIKVLKSKKITMGEITKKFEKKFAKFIGSKYALMTNSGSSANLLALSAIVNPTFKNRLNPGDEVLIPSVCWSTSLWPIVQNNLKPIFIDVDTDTLNISIEDIKKKISSKTRAIVCVHVLGVSSDMEKIKKICNKKKIIIIEDVCESLGAKFNNKLLGNYGSFGTYSFYYSHQITSGEGGMIVCNDKENYNLLKSLRSHGWSRDIILKNHILKKYNSLDKRFLFINSGYNLRPTEIQAAIANNQLKRLNEFIKTRDYNRNQIIKNLMQHPKWNNQFKFVKINEKIKPSWFGLPIMLSEKFKNKKKKFLKYLTSVGIENRPILSGNFLNQPCIEIFNLNDKKQRFINAQIIDDLGFFIGLHTSKISTKTSKFLANNLLKIDHI